MVAFDVETSHLFCITYQMTGFYMKCDTGLSVIIYRFGFNVRSSTDGMLVATVTCSSTDTYRPESTYFKITCKVSILNF